VAAARQRHAARLTIPPGVYRFDTIANNFHLLVDNVSDLTIDGQGAEFVFAQAWYGIGVGHVRRVLIKNLTVDYEPRVASLGIVQTESNGSTSIRVRDSNLVQVTVPGSCAAPGPPTGLTAVADSAGVTFAWRLGDLGTGAPDRFVLEAGYTPGNPVFSIPVTARVFRTRAPRGTYHVRVRAASSCGTSAPTAEATLVVP
jgi:hypothetical protein